MVYAPSNNIHIYFSITRISEHSYHDSKVDVHQSNNKK